MTTPEGPAHHTFEECCPACDELLSHCQGRHGEVGREAGEAILAAHDAGEHSRCHPNGCQVAADWADAAGPPAG
ncbi:MAG: hypothetical protein ACXWMU_02955 [Candidatus Limnocylindrales bacterium]